MKFNYQARNKEGKIERGIIEASSEKAAADLLQKYNVFVVSLKETKTPLSIFKSRLLKIKISKKDLAIFFRQLAVMIDSRVPVVQSLLSLASQSTNAGFRDKITKVSEMIEEGKSLSESFSFFSEIFDVFCISLIKSGEATGKISGSLYYLSKHLEREHDIGSKVKGAMVYPIVILSFLAVVIIVIMTFVMPKLVVMIKEIGGEIPLTTRILIGFYDFLIHYGWIISIAFLGLITFLTYYLKTEEGKKVYDKIAIKFPFIGQFLGKIFLAGFAENLSILVAAGLPVTQALKITKDTINNFVYREIVGEIEKDVSEGAKISSVLVKYPERIPAFVVQMVKVGEETGKLDTTLIEIVNFYQKEITNMVNNIMTIIEPILIIILGLGVAFLAISVLSPMYGMIGSL